MCKILSPILKSIQKQFSILGLKPKNVLIIEDSLVGVEAARQAGIDVIAIYDAYSAHELEEIKTQADYFVQDYAELLNAISAIKKMP